MKIFANSMKAMAAAGLLVGSTVAPLSALSAAPCTSAQAGCVLPVEPAPATAVVDPVEEGTGIGWLLPALLGVAAVVGAILLLDDDDDEAISA